MTSTEVFIVIGNISGAVLFATQDPTKAEDWIVGHLGDKYQENRKNYSIFQRADPPQEFTH